MTDAEQEVPMAEKRVVLTLPEMDKVVVRRDLPFGGGDGSERLFDLYLSPAASGTGRPPVVVIVAGFPDPGYERMLGRSFRRMGATVSWAELLAASGIAAVAYANRDPATDLDALFAHLRDHADGLGLDGERVGLWASSGNGPLALATLMRPDRSWLRCAALLYPFTLDVDGGTEVADAAATWRFAHPAAGRALSDLPTATALLVVRAGADATPGLNVALDRFVSAAERIGRPVRKIEQPEAPHAFDLLVDNEATRTTVREVLGFLRRHLGGSRASMSGS